MYACHRYIAIYDLEHHVKTMIIRGSKKPRASSTHLNPTRELVCFVPVPPPFAAAQTCHVAVAEALICCLISNKIRAKLVLFGCRGFKFGTNLRTVPVRVCQSCHIAWYISPSRYCKRTQSVGPNLRIPSAAHLREPEWALTNSGQRSFCMGSPHARRPR